MTTSEQFDQVIKNCKNIFDKKLQDYGASWRVLRPSSLTDQIFIKAERIRTLEIKKVQKVKEGIYNEYIGIINYCIISLIQMELGFLDKLHLKNDKIIILYDKYAYKSKQLMERKNHDYNEAWRSMRITSYTDLILMKLFRTKQIEDNDGKTIISEGIDANYYDIINYAIFALITLNENKNKN